MCFRQSVLIRKINAAPFRMFRDTSMELLLILMKPLLFAVQDSLTKAVLNSALMVPLWLRLVCRIDKGAACKDAS